MSVEVRDVTGGLWLWRQPHPEWSEDNADWAPEVSSFAVASNGVSLLLDPLAPHPSVSAVYNRIAKVDAIVILKPDHIRDVDLFARWYGADAYGPFLFWAGEAPKSKLTPVRPGDVLPGGIVALDDGRGMMETPLYLPEQQALVFADGLTAPEGELRVWSTPWHETRVLAALRAMLGLPFEHVLVSHGEPVHTRADFEAALDRDPWAEVEGS
jgi:hypothetical protein